MEINNYKLIVCNNRKIGCFLLTEKDDYGIKTKRFRHTYTKESYDELLLSCGFQIYKPYYVCENSRNKLWYDVVVRKK